MERHLWAALLPLVLVALCRGGAAGEPWRAVEQPELKQALEKAAGGRGINGVLDRALFFSRVPPVSAV